MLAEIDNLARCRSAIQHAAAKWSHPAFPFGTQSGPASFKYFSVHAVKSYLDARYEPGDMLVFGGETSGLGADFLRARMADAYRIPIFEPGVRSLNLANAVSIVVYEALRQMQML